MVNNRRRLFCGKKEKEITMIDNYNLEHKQENIEKTKWQLEILKRQEDRLLASCKEEERKLRTHRLIERGAILESFIDDAPSKTNDEIKAILEAAFRRQSQTERFGAPRAAAHHPRSGG
jgi:hypothetical protein